MDINSPEIAPLIPLTVLLIVGGLLLWWFARRDRRNAKRGERPESK
jgi:uncharacterized membrane protein